MPLNRLLVLEHIMSEELMCQYCAKQDKTVQERCYDDSVIVLCDECAKDNWGRKMRTGKLENL
jgi:hypothetical protein